MDADGALVGRKAGQAHARSVRELQIP
jgi:hypothetical protein